MNYQSKFWEQYFKYYDILLKVIPYQELLEKITVSLNVSANLKILDLGAGTGNLQYYLPGELEITSLDYSCVALKRLNEKFPKSKVFKHSIYERLPFKENTFDRIVSNNVLYTLQKKEWRFVISEIRRVTKPNGIIVISNLHQDFKAIHIYQDHIKKSIKRKGIIKTIWELIHLIYPTIQMMRFNHTIRKNNEIGKYSFLEADEQREVCEEIGLVSTQKTQRVYSNQAFLNVFINQKNESKTGN